MSLSSHDGRLEQARRSDVAISTFASVDRQWRGLVNGTAAAERRAVTTETLDNNDEHDRNSLTMIRLSDSSIFAYDTAYAPLGREMGSKRCRKSQ